MATVASALAQPPTQPTPPARRVPPLCDGDHLTREEFERRYDATPGLKKAELIEGRVYLPPPPVSAEGHGFPHADLLAVLGVYRAATPGVRVADNGSIRLDLDNMPQPDVAAIVLPAHGGQARIGTDGYIEGAPEFIAEVARTSASYDLHDKLHVYRRNGVREYVVWRTFDAEIDYFLLREGLYVRHAPDNKNVFRSDALLGLWLDAGSLVREDLASALKVIQEGLASPEHAEFVKKLQQAAVAQPKT
ncbi:MAG: Uma2 family endonuclease [Tepidisphaeraceae bacterium]